jgi:hypothetical protein
MTSRQQHYRRCRCEQRCTWTSTAVTAVQLQQKLGRCRQQVQRLHLVPQQQQALLQATGCASPALTKQC